MTARALESASLDLATPEHYERHGYPHPEWTWVRQHDPVFWYDRPNVDPFWAITKHADIIKIGKQPELFLNAPRLAVFTRDLPPPEEGTSRHLLNMDPPDHGRYRKVTSQLVHAARDSRHGRQGRARHARGARRGGRRSTTAISSATSRPRSRSR